MQSFGIPTDFTTNEISQLLGITRQGVSIRAKRENWIADGKRKGQGGSMCWLCSSMPEKTLQIILDAFLKQKNSLPERTSEELQEEKERLEYQADIFRRKPEKTRLRAEKRSAILRDVMDLFDNGMSLTQAFASVGKEYEVKPATIRNWYYGTDKKQGVKNLPRVEWLYALMDRYTGRTALAEWTEKAEEYFRSFYLNKHAANLSDCYRRMSEVASGNSWIIPSERTVRRRMEEIPLYRRDYARGKDKDFRNVMPPQKRDCTHFESGEAINGDGLHLDFYTIFEDGEISQEPVMWAWQDIRSRKIISRRIGKSENTDIIRLSMYDLLGFFTPRKLWVDNTRAAANKLLMGNFEGRNRFKNLPQDIEGLFQKAGIECHATKPDHEKSSPGSKPIERVWRDLHPMIKNNPRLAGYGTKNNPVPIALLQEAIDEEINRYNSQTGRRGYGMDGKSCNQVFEDNFKPCQTVISPFDRDLFLLNREIVTIQKNGRIAINAGKGEGKNTYWSEISSIHAKQRVAVYYDPENLTKNLKICNLDGSYIGEARYEVSAAFDSKEAGKTYAKERASRLKSEKAAVKAEQRMTQLEAQQFANKVEAAEMPKAEHTIIRMGDHEVSKMIADKEMDNEAYKRAREQMSRNIERYKSA